MVDILAEWKQKIEWNSSPYNPKRYIILNDKFNLDEICYDLYNWFGEDAFKFNTKDFIKAEYTDILQQNWLLSILSANNIKAVQTLIEFWQVLRFHSEIIDDNRLEELINYSNKKIYRQFRDYYFELFTFYHFEMNNIENQFKTYEGRDQLEGIITLGGEECLVECRKLYSISFQNLEMNTEFIAKLKKLLSKFSIGLSVSISYEVVNKSKIDIVLKSISKAIRELTSLSSSQLYLPINYKFDHNISDTVEYHVDQITREINYRNSEGFDNFIRVSTLLVPLDDVPEKIKLKFEIDSSNSATEESLKKRFISALDKKRKKRSKSKYKRRLYVFDSENYPGFDRGLFIMDAFSENIKAEVQNYLDSKKTNDTVLILLRESNSVDFPRIRKILITNKGGEFIGDFIDGMKLL